MRGASLLACLLFVLALSASCGKTNRDGPGQVQRCKTDADCDQGRCLPLGICSAEPGGLLSPLDLRTVDKVDLLFVIDNSISMADKQAILREAVPRLVNGLVSPAVDPASGSTLFPPVADIHIGIVSSSLGGHGADICSPAFGVWNPTQDDQGHLIGSVRSGLTSYQNLGFLAWDPNNTKGGETNPANLIANFQQMVSATGEQGCGFEATLEAWYRFLIDPNPPQFVINQSSNAVPVGTDEVLLAQRAAFLRPDSLLAIVMLTDENDCSVIDAGIGWLSAQASSGDGAPFHLPRATSQCASNPNDVCCRSCGATGPDGDCPPLASDPECLKGARDQTSDALALRCWEQKRRFGVDFLYPTERYVTALKSPLVRDRDSVEQANPLFSDLSGGTAVARDPGLVFLAGIVGVPWQDIATPETLNDPQRLEYLRAENINWDWIVGDVNRFIKPLDPLMHEGPDPRSGVNPAINASLAPPTSLNPQENPINGHEYNIPERYDLQYACIFDLVPDRDCSAGGTACDCGPTEMAANKPLCQPPGGGPAGTTQYWAKAYPGLRPLQVLKDAGENSIVASICPKVLNGEPTSPDYGYNPAIRAIVARLGEALGPKCLPRALDVDDDPASPTVGRVLCDVVQAFPPGACSSCDGRPGSSDLAPNDPLVAAAQRTLADFRSCGAHTGVRCEDFCVCRINQLTGDALTACQAGAPTHVSGFCYVDASINAELVSGCPASQRQKLRFVGDNVPDQDSIAMISCSAAAP